MTSRAAAPVRGSSLVGATLLLLTLTPPARAQLEVAVQGGVDAARLDRPERALVQPARGVSLLSAPGEARALGLRASGVVAPRWRWDGGVVWSRNTSALGTVGPKAPEFETTTLFLSASMQALLLPPEAPIGLRAGAGPALVMHRGSGASLLTRQTDVGAMLNISSQYSLDGRLAIRLDAQEYLFSSSFRDPYAADFLGAPVQPAGSRFRHELVVLAGLSWLTH